MGLDLEIAGAVRDLDAEEAAVVTQLSPIKKLRDSHHAVAKLLSRGMEPVQVSLQTGYSVATIYRLEMDPAFRQLKSFYARTNEVVAQEVESIFLGVARDMTQELHERLHEAPETFTNEELLDATKVFADRAGYAPVQRSINKNVNLNIGERLDAARRKKEEIA